MKTAATQTSSTATPLWNQGGIKIAFVGITTPESITKSTPAYFQDEEGNYIYGIAGGADGQELYAAVQSAVDAAKAESADVVIAIGHLGVEASSSPWTSKEVIANTTGIDAFIDGHSHTTMEGEYVTAKDGEQVLLTQTGYYLSNLGEMTVTVTTASDDTQTVSITTELLSAADLGSVTPSESVAALENAWISDVETALGAQIGESDIDFYASDVEETTWLVRKQETNLGDLTADAYYWYANEVASLDCDIAMINGGGVRANVLAGSWTYLTCKNINPFGNVLCVVEVTGQDILDALEFSSRYAEITIDGSFMQFAGLTYKVDTSSASGVNVDDDDNWVSGPSEYRVYDVKIYNKETGTYDALDLDETYRLCGTNYTLINSGGGYNMFADSTLVLDGISEDYLAIAEYVKAFTDTDGDGYANIASANSPLAAYSGYVINYEDINGSGRIYIAEGKDEEPVPEEPSTEEDTTTAPREDTTAAGEDSEDTTVAGNSDTSTPQVGDAADLAAYIALMAAACAACAGAFVYRRKTGR